MSIETWMKFAHPDDLKISKELLEKHFKGQSDYYELESRMRHKNGDWVWVKDRGRVATWAEDGKPLMMLGTHLDITARKAAEKEIGDINEQLRKSNAEKDMLFSIIAHDLKSPMSGLVASSDMLVNEFEGLSRKDCQTLFASMRNSAGNVMTLLDDLLQWSLMSQGAWTMRLLRVAWTSWSTPVWPQPRIWPRGRKSSSAAISRTTRVSWSTSP